MEQRELHASLVFNRPAASLPHTLRRPSPSEIREFGEGAWAYFEARNTRLRLASRFHALTKSLTFSWRAATALHSFCPSGNGKLTDSQKAQVCSAAELMLFALNGSPEEGERVACAVGRLSGCRKDHAAEFMHALSTAAESEPSFVRKALEGFPESSHDQSLLSPYARTLFLIHAMGGEGPALRFAELFSKVGPFPGSAKLMAESLAFFVERVPMRNLPAFVDKFSEDWEKTLDSQIFRDNPPD